MWVLELSCTCVISFKSLKLLGGLRGRLGPANITWILKKYNWFGFIESVRWIKNVSGRGWFIFLDSFWWFIFLDSFLNEWFLLLSFLRAWIYGLQIYIGSVGRSHWFEMKRPGLLPRFGNEGLFSNCLRMLVRAEVRGSCLPVAFLCNLHTGTFPWVPDAEEWECFGLCAVAVTKRRGCGRLW